VTITIRPKAEQLAQLLRCAEIGGERLAELARFYEEMPNPPLLPDDLLTLTREKLTADEAELLLSQVLPIRTMVRSTGASAREIGLALREAFNEEDAAKWDSIATQFQSLVESAPVRLVTKAMELSYDYANLLRQIRIVTDLRPLFSQDGERVEAAVISHTLRLSYSSDDGNHELSLALDLQDIEKLRLQCERAVTKSKSVKREFEMNNKKPCIISGDSKGEQDG
jgi:hypothetical protein